MRYSLFSLFCVWSVHCLFKNLSSSFLALQLSAGRTYSFRVRLGLFGRFTHCRFSTIPQPPPPPLVRKWTPVPRPNRDPRPTRWGRAFISPCFALLLSLLCFAPFLLSGCCLNLLFFAFVINVCVCVNTCVFLTFAFNCC